MQDRIVQDRIVQDRIAASIDNYKELGFLRPEIWRQLSSDLYQGLLDRHYIEIYFPLTRQLSIHIKILWRLIIELDLSNHLAIQLCIPSNNCVSTNLNTSIDYVLGQKTLARMNGIVLRRLDDQIRRALKSKKL